jgi:superfamily II DNA or RNA helicase
VKIPAFLQRYQAQAKRLLDAAQDIEFSGPTYQVKIHDPDSKEEVWSFLQLDPQDNLREAFCSCEAEERGCWHLAASYLCLFDKEQRPLHTRFKKSFWKALGNWLLLRYGNKTPKTPQWIAEGRTERGKRLIEELYRKKIPETEENSIKFSNLSEEELEAWRLGKPGPELAFELSRWSDFTKILLRLNEKRPFKITFKETSKYPDQIEMANPDLFLQCHLPLQGLLKLIPYLHEVDSNLNTYNRLEDYVKSISFDPKSCCFHLNLQPIPTAALGIPLDQWIYIPHQGFYPTSFAIPEKICGEGIEPLLQEHFEEIGRIPGVKWRREPISLQYHLHLDSAWNLHLSPYIDEPGDLEQGFIWGHFCWHPSKGLFQFVKKPYEDLPKQVEEAELSEFIRQHAFWLNQQEGFEVHLGSVETQIRYQVSSQGDLSFEQRLPLNREAAKEFGAWIYLPGEGFFHKTQQHVHLPLDFQRSLRADLVPSFIRQNQEELKLIPNFFLEEDPLQDAGLEASLEADETISVSPIYQLKPAYEKSLFRFYEEWIYIADGGFAELSPGHRLPSKLREHVIIPLDKRLTFLSDELPSLKMWIRKIDPRLERPLFMRLTLTALENLGQNQWRAALSYQTEKGAIPISSFVQAIQKGKRLLFTPFGWIDVLGERFKWLRKLQTPPEEGKETLIFSTLELLRLHAFEEITVQGEASALFQSIIELKISEACDYSALQSHLRPYQKLGVNWLFSLYAYLLGGLLCDEMGLGKTHQAMALMAAVQKIRPQARFLVVCPTSVLYHWEDKLQEFFPTLSVLTFHGPLRERTLEKDFSLLLTSYGILRRELDKIGKLSFDIAIYDEIQVAKNHKSKLYAVLQGLRADMKIGLTGTPIENRLRELKTLFDLVLPGYMPGESDYMRLIVTPIEKKRDMQQKGLLQRLIHPFILRRQKKEVLSDLPDKTEEIAHCDLHPAQERLYREVLFAQRDQLMQNLQDSSQPVSFLHVFSLLSRLKQICDHPALYLKKTEEYEKYHSGKWDLFVELLNEARESQQKVVVYSQYLGMLDIIEEHLRSAGVGFASLRGSTRDRKEQISLFAQDPSCEVFVASLRAAGLGIDLTAASVVIHYDRWWNAARENQATDRVHRFGQHRGVQVFKLVTKNTFEERIHQIIERKKELTQESLTFDDHDVLKTFTREELYQLLLYTQEK